MTGKSNPRISLNKLTEYLGASSTRRKSIIRDQKYPVPYKTGYYRDAQGAIQRFISSGMLNEEILKGKINDLYRRSSGSDYEETKNQSNAAAIQCFLEFYRNIDIEDFEPIIARNIQPKLCIANLDISVYPDILLHGEDKRHGLVVGGIKLYFSKHDEARIDEKLGKYPSTILYEYLAQQNTNRRSLRQACIVVDVFGKKQFAAPRTYAKIFADIEGACEEIVDRWPSIPPKIPRTHTFKKAV